MTTFKNQYFANQESPEAFCSPCAHASEHGWWGRKGTHCRECHISWHALGESHRKTCHQHFSADSVAVLHEVFCSSDPMATAESMYAATRATGNPIFDQRERKGRKLWVRWIRPESSQWEAA